MDEETHKNGYMHTVIQSKKKSESQTYRQKKRQT